MNLNLVNNSWIGQLGKNLETYNLTDRKFLTYLTDLMMKNCNLTDRLDGRNFLTQVSDLIVETSNLTDQFECKYF